MNRPMLKAPLPGLNDEEGTSAPDEFRPVIDAHTHLFPAPLFLAIWDWFDAYGWPIRYRLTSEEIIEFLIEKGVARIVGLHYAHKPGIAKELNRYIAALARRYPEIVGTATVFPGEKNACDVLEAAFDLGLRAVKLHAHVQGFAMDSPEMRTVYEACVRRRRPLIMHVGREPKSPCFAYPVDPYDVCSAAKLEGVLQEYPDLRVCVPHLGADEFEVYASLLMRYDNLWTDTTMTLADYLPLQGDVPLESMRIDRVMYGTDFPNIPYAWDRELRKLCGRGLPDSALKMILADNATAFFAVAGD